MNAFGHQTSDRTADGFDDFAAPCLQVGHARSQRLGRVVFAHGQERDAIDFLQAVFEGIGRERFANIPFGRGTDLHAQSISIGFTFLSEPAGFSIGEGLLSFDASQPYWRAFLVGLLNTLRAAAGAIVLATALGLASAQFW